MTTLDFWELKEEMVVFLRNQDVFTVTERGVTTTAATGTFTNATTHTISVTNVRNIRSIVIGGVTKTFGTDYTVDYTFDNSGTNACKITFTASQSGAYTITYDYGTDIIFSEYPRADLSLSSYPRIAVDLLGSDSKEAAIGGNTIVTNVTFSITVYATTVKKVENTITTIRTKIVNNKKAFYHIKFVTILGNGPLIKSPERNDKVIQRNLDLMAPLNYEEA